MSAPDRDPPTAVPSSAAGRARFRLSLARVLTIQAVALLLLWLLQRRYAG